MDTLKTDVLILGSGFGGSLSALVLNRIGLNVVIVDRQRHPRFAGRHEAVDGFFESSVEGNEMGHGCHLSARHQSNAYRVSSRAPWGYDVLSPEANFTPAP